MRATKAKFLRRWIWTLCQGSDEHKAAFKRHYRKAKQQCKGLTFHEIVKKGLPG